MRLSQSLVQRRKLLALAIGACLLPAGAGGAARLSSPKSDRGLPWEPRYRRGGTAADVLGPDGKTWFPDWTKCGVQGGIPHVRVVATIERFGGRPDDGRDDAEALQKACEAAGRAGGGAILLGRGTYHLDGKVLVSRSGVVIRGAGRDATKIVIRYGEKEDSKTKGVITFAGRKVGRAVRLAEDAVRGGTELALERYGGLKAGDWVYLKAPASERWRKLVGGVTCPYDPFRLYMARVVQEVKAGVRGRRVRINQPLRIDFPAVDGSFAQKVEPIERCGIEDLSIRQEHRQPKIQTVLFTHAVNCWSRGVRVDMCGRNPVYGHTVKWMEIRDCEFNDSHDKGGGGTGYVGFESGWDCLMDGVVSRDMRHAPCLEWGSSGCVIRNSTFINSDAQCHSGWCHENLFENCVITNPNVSGSYGHAFFTTGPRDRAHGPIGPRNVIYNCHFLGANKNGLVLSGSNENWIVLHNRFESRNEAVVCRGVNFDHVIVGNVFVVRGAKPFIRLDTKGEARILIARNRLYGGDGKGIRGSGAASADARDNQVYAKPSRLPPRPQPDVPSIYEWQKNEAKRRRRGR